MPFNSDKLNIKTGITIVLKVLFLFSKNPEKYVELRETNWAWFIKDKEFAKYCLPVLKQLMSTVLFTVNRHKLVYIHYYKEMNPFITNLTDDMYPTADNWFVVLDFLNALRKTKQLFIFNNTILKYYLGDKKRYEEHSARLDRPLITNEQREFSNICDRVSYEFSKFPNNFITCLKQEGILNEEDVYYLLLKLNSVKVLFEIVNLKEVYKVLLFIECLMKEYEIFISPIYTICNYLQIKKTEEKFNISIRHVLKIRTEILRRYSEGCTAYEYVIDSDDGVYKGIVLNHLRETYSCRCMNIRRLLPVETHMNEGEYYIDDGEECIDNFDEDDSD